MPWARFEPQSLDEKLELARDVPRRSSTSASTTSTGSSSRTSRARSAAAACIRAAATGSLEIGYWVRADAIGQGFATEVAAVLTRVGFEHFGLDRVDLRVDPENERSAKIPRKLGFVEEGRLRRRLPPKTTAARAATS